MFRNAALVIVAQGFLVLSGCTGTGFPKQAPDGVAEPQIAFTVWERTMPASEGGSTIEIVEVQRVDEHMEHRAIAHLPDGQQYLGPLVPVRGDVPLNFFWLIWLVCR